MDANKDNREQSRLFRDLRLRNERREDVARLLEARRRRQIERVLQVTYPGRFRKYG